MSLLDFMKSTKKNDPVKYKKKPTHIQKDADW